ncbi:putative gypsy-29-i dr [Trichonephila inaurata madagascariensis]|uniref:Putative gypsy-29-i dr n=1 Tax=Trichonephila inaurata madagascariensis TaxID=2747483 RepID=A0A8X6IHT0_9ARAC|nr:putative gypsy-29-i dr [Trichonephila inaurata madagascariensis]
MPNQLGDLFKGKIKPEDNNKRISDGTLDELNILRMQSLNDDEDTVSDNSQLLTEIEYLRKQVELLSNSSKQSPLPMPPPSQVDPNIATILSTIMETQKQILERQEFLAHQSERKFRHNESLVDYIYSKDALLEKASFTIPQPYRGKTPSFHSPYVTLAFIVEQLFHESTPRPVVVDFSRTINPITKIDTHPIDQMEDVTQRTAGKSYISKMDVKSAFNCISIRVTDIYKTGFVTPDGHYEFLLMPIGVTNGPSTMTRAIKLAYDHLAPHNVYTYIDDISTSQLPS